MHFSFWLTFLFFFLHFLTNFSSYFWFRMEIWHALQEELNRLYEMFVQRNPYFETNGGKVSIVAHSLGCVVTYDILTGWTQDVEHSWYNLQTRGGGNGMQDLKRSRHFRRPSTHGQAGNLHATPAQSGLLFRIENFFCLGKYSFTIMNSIVIRKTLKNYSFQGRLYPYFWRYVGEILKIKSTMSTYCPGVFASTYLTSIIRAIQWPIEWSPYSWNFIHKSNPFICFLQTIPPRFHISKYQEKVIIK